MTSWLVTFLRIVDVPPLRSQSLYCDDFLLCVELADATEVESGGGGGDDELVIVVLLVYMLLVVSSQRSFLLLKSGC